MVSKFPTILLNFLSADGIAKECNYQVVWRVGHEVGARFVSLVRPGGSSPLSF